MLEIFWSIVILNNFLRESLIEMLIFKQRSEGGEGMRQCLKEEHARQGIQQKL